MKNDSQIQYEVLQELKWGPSVNHKRIGASVINEVVTLSGTIPSYIENWQR